MQNYSPIGCDLDLALVAVRSSLGTTKKTQGESPSASKLQCPHSQRNSDKENRHGFHRTRVLQFEQSISPVHLLPIAYRSGGAIIWGTTRTQIERYTSANDQELLGLGSSTMMQLC